MITKERLEELIEQGATIYVVCWGRVKELNLNDAEYMEVENGDIYYEIADNEPRTTDLSHLFETKEDAEEYAEFGNITRTERLPYFPKYENIEYERGHFISKFHIKDNYDGFGKLMVIKDYVILVQCSSLGVLHEEYFNKPATRENYNEARRLCVKLFKGE